MKMVILLKCIYIYWFDAITFIIHTPLITDGRIIIEFAWKEKRLVWWWIKIAPVSSNIWMLGYQLECLRNIRKCGLVGEGDVSLEDGFGGFKTLSVSYLLSQHVSSKMLLQRHACLTILMLPPPMIAVDSTALWNHDHQIKCFLLYANLVTESLHSNRKIIKQPRLAQTILNRIPQELPPHLAPS